MCTIALFQFEIGNLMDLTISDYFVVCFAIAMTLYNFRKFMRNGHKLIYRDVVMTAGYLSYAIVHIAGSFNDGTALAFLASVGLSFIVASLGLVTIETITSVRVRLGHVLDFTALVDKSVRWVVISVMALYVTNIAYDGFMQDQGTRIDLLCADTTGMCLALFCLEYARQQMRDMDFAKTAESS